MSHALVSSKIDNFSGTLKIPGDKSISHRSLMFGGLATGTTRITGLLEGEDVLCTAAAMKAMGATIVKDAAGVWHVTGVDGVLKQPAEDLYMGNSGTSTRLLAGVVAGHDIQAKFTGDTSLSRRPMMRVIKPLTEMGAVFEAQEGGRLPMTVRGKSSLRPLTYESPVSSAQVKSAIMLAALNAAGRTTVIEEGRSRDHTENMFRHFGVSVEIEDLPNGSQAIHVDGPAVLQGSTVDVPSDPSSAAFAVAAALLVKGSQIRLENVGINERRIGFYKTVEDMGADITFENKRMNAGEPVADIIVRGHGALKGVEVPAGRVPSMIDEFPVLSMLAACATGDTVMTGLAELRVKESDRLQMVADGLEKCGVSLDTGQDSLVIHGTGQAPRGGAMVATALDHRIAMSFLVLGLVTDEPVSVDDGETIHTSFPGFVELMNGAGAHIEPLDEGAERKAQ